MKISKVDHIHVGINDKKLDTRLDTGFIYNPVKRSSSKIPIKEKLNDRKEAAQKLYSVFNSFDKMFDRYVADVWGAKKSADFIKKLRYIGEDINKEFGQLLKKGIEQYKNIEEPNHTIISKVYDYFGDSYIEAKALRKWDDLKDHEIEALIYVMVSYYLRKSLCGTIDLDEGKIRKVLGTDVSVHADTENAITCHTNVGDMVDKKSVSIRSTIQKLLISMLQQDPEQRRKMFGQIGKMDVYIFILVLHKDFSKIRQMQNLEKSIRNQNVPVQCRRIYSKKATAGRGGVSSEDKVVRLMPSSAVFDNQPINEISRRSYEFSFLQKYAAAEDKHDRDKILIEVNSLLVLFLYGEQAYGDRSEGKAADLEIVPCDQREDWKHFSPDAYQKLNDYLSQDDKRASDSKVFWSSLKSELRKAVLIHYQESLRVLEGKYKAEGKKKEEWPAEMKEAMYWITWFEDCVERILRIQRANTRLSLYKLESGYLYKKSWREFLSFMGQKYIALGKAVYHIILPHNYMQGCKYDLGQVPAFYKERGITGFDYEYIKAVEALQRETSAYVASAAGNFIRSVSRQQDESKDLLLESQSAYFRNMTPENLSRAYIRVMRYFGGESAWQDWDALSKASDIEQFKRELLNIIRSCLYVLRNQSFHYAEGIVNELGGLSQDEAAVIESIIERRIDSISGVIREKYYSNNAWMFYADENIKGLLNVLYKKTGEIPAQVPSFHSACKKDQLLRLFMGETYKRADREEAAVWENTFYFIMKEIYYKGFLQDSQAVSLVKGCIRGWKVSYDKSMDKNERFAIQNFKKIISEGGIASAATTIGGFCQAVMGEYNRQNNDLQKVVSGKNTGSDSDKRIYEHFPLLLYRALREAFKLYVLKNQKVYGDFVKEPFDNKACKDYLRTGQCRDSDDFCKGWTTTAYKDLRTTILEDSLFSRWFIVAHFLSPVQLNHYKGSLKSYLSYTADIGKRAKVTGIKIEINNARNKQYRDLLKVLDLVAMYSGRTSGNYRDYFPAGSGKTSEDVYAEFVYKFVDFYGEGSYSEVSFEKLKQFCNSQINGVVNKDGKNARIGLYYDNENPIPNRNLIYADMYGNEGLIADCLSRMQSPVIVKEKKKGKKGQTERQIHVGKVLQKEIEEYYKLEASLENVFRQGYCDTKEEIKDQRHFIKLKNRVELVDIAIFTDIINDLFNRLVVWCNIWERDQMYLRLGYQYVKLFFTDIIPADDKRRAFSVINGPSFSDGAILYQIEAVYNFSLPVYVCGDTKPVTASKPSGSGKSTQRQSEKTFVEKYSTKDVFDGGFELFDNEDHYKVVKSRRNYIDHLNYYSSQQGKNNHSIMELFAFMYNDVFRYDTKLRKSTTYVFENILSRYRVLSSLSLELGKLESGGIVEHDNADGSLNVNDSNSLTGRSIAIFKSSRGERGLQSDVYTYKLKKTINEYELRGDKKITHTKEITKTVTDNARSDTFLKQLDALLIYKQYSREL